MYHCVTCITVSHFLLCHLSSSVTCLILSHVLICHMYHCVTCLTVSHVSLSHVSLCHMYHCVTCLTVSQVLLCRVSHCVTCITNLFVSRVSASHTFYFVCFRDATTPMLHKHSHGGFYVDSIRYIFLALTSVVCARIRWKSVDTCTLEKKIMEIICIWILIQNIV